ncbi:hypothetical protein LHJ74_20445 [Streptomyces sp. N2-109]|uniref:WXG100 family type VII secretion target n=1 Tax=Streptomyces gossypii TaxID=2883101 RepID=A0ABT2JWG6_9ACTN|nr:hypothetical protein [Streptomyces gossypii]MCT2592242.1 hypothetical protein [Streptomyces gossypii]
MGVPDKVLNISTADLKSAAPTFQTQSTKLLEGATTLGTKLAALGQPWGGEEQVRKFAETYSDQRMKIEYAVGILVQGLASVKAAMTDMTDGHVDNEEGIRGMFNDMAPPPEWAAGPEWRPPMAPPVPPAPPEQGDGQHG